MSYLVEPFTDFHPYKHGLLKLKPWETQFPWLIAGFSKRTGGSSAEPYASLNTGLHVGDDPRKVIDNRQIISQQIGRPFNTWVSANQVHEAVVQYVDQASAGRGRQSMTDALPDVDGLYTNNPRLTLTMMYADCVPLFFVAPEKKLIGLAHAGWRGTVKNIAKEMVTRWVSEYGCPPQNIYAAIGPSISGCCYEIDNGVAQYFNPHQGFSKNVLLSSKADERWMLDLKKANVELLVQAGIMPEHIEVSQWCTSCRTDLFFSHRREYGKTGRMVAFIALKEEERFEHRA